MIRQEKRGNAMDMEQMIADFEEMLGWPYASPGSNDRRGIDCSGAFVRAYRQQGESIYHGSNRMARTACAWLRPAGQVFPQRGMVAFKARDSQPPEDYRPGGAYYDPDLPQDFYHVGLVVSAAPLRLIHATPPCVRADDSLRGWTHLGWLKDFPEEERNVEERTVTASTVNFRAEPSTSASLLDRIPQGTVLETEQVNEAWVRTMWQGKTGYVMAQYLSGKAEETVALPRALLESLRDALEQALGVGA